MSAVGTKRTHAARVRAQPQGTARSLSAETPRATSTATEPSRETGCSANVRAEPPIRTLAPAPIPRPISPEAPTYSPASAPAGIPTVGASTAQPNTPPAVRGKRRAQHEQQHGRTRFQHRLTPSNGYWSRSTAHISNRAECTPGAQLRVGRSPNWRGRFELQ